MQWTLATKRLVTAKNSGSHYKRLEPDNSFQGTVRIVVVAFSPSTTAQNSEIYFPVRLIFTADHCDEKRREGSVSNDFLELLLFGTTSLELQSFLLQDLTDKGLKKLGFSIENSYCNIQKLVVRQLQRVCHNITSHLSDLHGMSQWFDRYGVLGLNPSNVHAGVQMAGAFAISASELQQVIDTSIKNFKAFFRWLYIAILRLSNENPPADISKMTQHDVQFVADFLRDNFTHLVEEDENIQEEPVGSLNSVKSVKHGFRLEKVGQYLKKEDLVQPPNYTGNPWIQFLNSTTFHKDSKILYPLMHGKSVLQGKALLDQAISSAVLEPAHVIGDSMKLQLTFQLFTAETIKEDAPLPKVCQLTDDERKMMWIVYARQQFPCDQIYLLRYSLTQPSELQVVQVSVGKFTESPDEQTDNYVFFLFLSRFYCSFQNHKKEMGMVYKVSNDELI
ncbi:anaphase promoting complex subunit 4 [Bulinus truncatus]|nr:anaphase promoting complex subunit 4 [Bulinus truncatus]